MQLGNLGNVALEQGDLRSATTYQRQALMLKPGLGARRPIAITLEALAAIAATDGRARRAARLLGAASAIRELIGTPQPAPERTAISKAVAQAKAVLCALEWHAAHLEGKSLSIEQAIAYGLE